MSTIPQWAIPEWDSIMDSSGWPSKKRKKSLTPSYITLLAKEREQVEQFMDYIDTFLEEGLGKFAEDHEHEYRIGTREIFEHILKIPMKSAGDLYVRALKKRMNNLEWESVIVTLNSRNGKHASGYRKLKGEFLGDFISVLRL